MNPVERAIRAVDHAQQRFTPASFVFGVVKKYGDDNGGVLVSNLAYSAFVSIFPLLLVLVTILGLVVAGHPSIRTDVLNAVANQVPLLGHTLTGNVHTLQRSSLIGLIVGLVALVYGATGLAQAGLFTMAQVWNLPGPARPGYLQRLGRAALFLALLGAGVVVTTGLASLITYLHQKGLWFDLLVELVTAAFTVGMFLGGFRVLTPKGVPTGKLLPGAITAGARYLADSPLPAQRLGVRRVRHRARPDRLYLPGGGSHRLQRRDQCGPGPEAVAAGHGAAAADRSRPGQHGAAGAAESAAPGGARRGDLRRPSARRGQSGQHPADAGAGHAAREGGRGRAAGRAGSGLSGRPGVARSQLTRLCPGETAVRSE
jgi:uncharacterized BrkB/YihY/UPF0761 family membrane protein